MSHQTDFTAKCEHTADMIAVRFVVETTLHSGAPPNSAATSEFGSLSEADEKAVALYTWLKATHEGASYRIRILDMEMPDPYHAPIATLSYNGGTSAGQ